MSVHDRSTPAVLRRLATVVHMRLSVAELVLQKEVHELRNIRQEIKVRQSKVEKLCEDLCDLKEFLIGPCGDSASSPDAVGYQIGLRRRFWIDYDLQRERYYLDMTYEEYAAQTQKVIEKRNACTALKHQYDTIVEKLRCARLSRVVRRILKEDAERQYQLRWPAMETSQTE